MSEEATTTTEPTSEPQDSTQADLQNKIQDFAQRLSNVEYAQQTTPVAQPAPVQQPAPPPELVPPEYPEAEADESIQSYNQKMQRYLQERDAYERQKADMARLAEEQKAQQDAYTQRVEDIRSFFSKTPEAKQMVDELRPLVNDKGYSIQDAYDLVRLRRAEADARKAAESTATRRSPLRSSDTATADGLKRNYDNLSDAINGAYDEIVSEFGSLESLAAD